ncbi:MAG TPA: PIG-L family deacetylase [Acidimicrobiales bacterium]|nr:PIG-L family deacetylase [Acidimicrobiales bacterium]
MGLTLMAVHAHPDDEASSTGGILAKYSAEGVETVLVVCTNGEQGDGPGGVKPGDDGHDEAEVVAMRRRELDESVRILGITAVERLGYRDSGMMGWEANTAPGAFWGLSVEQAAAPLVELIDRYRPDVVVTYDDYGFYGHPDHIQAHRITVAALDRSGHAAKLYFPTIRRSLLSGFRERMAEADMEMPDVDESQFGSPDEMIGATIDCSGYAMTKRAALAAHSSQTDNMFFLRMPESDFASIFGTEEFIRARDHTGTSTPENDLFAGLR